MFAPLSVAIYDINCMVRHIKQDIVLMFSSCEPFLVMIAVLPFYNENTNVHLTASFPGQLGQASTRKAKIILDGWQWHQLCDHVQTLLQTDNHTSTSSLNFFLPARSFPDAQPTA